MSSYLGKYILEVKIHLSRKRPFNHILQHTEKMAKKRGKEVQIPLPPIPRPPGDPEPIIPTPQFFKVTWKIPIVEEKFIR